MPQAIGATRRNLTLGLLLIVNALSYLDRQVFTLFQDDIKKELLLNDMQLGLLSGLAFALFYTVAAFPVARYADHGDRRLVIAVSVAVWSAATAACGVAQNFVQMLLARVGLAAGEAGAGPAAASLLTDIYPPQRRTIVLSAGLAASSVGLSGGLALAGWLSNFFDWRAVFLLVGLPGLAIGLLVWLMAAEPRRMERAASAAPRKAQLGETMRIMAGNPSLRWVALVLMTVPVTGFSLIIWGASFFRRVHGMSAEQTGFWLGGAMLGGLVIGNLLAGWLGDKFGNARPAFNGVLAAVGLLVAFPFALAFALSGNAYVALVCFMVVKFMMTLHLGPIMSLSFAQVPHNMRATMSAMINMFIGIAGTGIGGTLAGVLSLAFAAQHGDMSLRYALAILSGCLVIGGFAALMAGRTVVPHPDAE